jgi:caa(3)-type oxidase subunit IV
METTKRAAARTGMAVFIALAVLTIVEFIVSQVLASATVPLILIALLKAGLIVQYFMHVYRLWREESH